MKHFCDCYLISITFRTRDVSSDLCTGRIDNGGGSNDDDSVAMEDDESYLPEFAIFKTWPTTTANAVASEPCEGTNPLTILGWIEEMIESDD